MLKRILTGLVAAFLICAQVAPSFAALSNAPTFPVTPNTGVVQFLAGTDTAGTYKTLYTGATQGSKCSGMWITSNDTASHLVTIQLVRSAVKYGGMSISTGTTLPGFATGVPPINPMSSTNWPGLPIDQAGNPFFYLAGTGDTIQATFATALTATDFINIVITCADF